ncbi:MAG: uracil-DNA glycosylase family protein [Gammaproteobacteria bacterium]
MARNTLQKLSAEIRRCTICAEHLPLGPRPVFQISSIAKILIAGQAPGTRVHETGIPFNDPSGDRLRDWMGIDREKFYDPAIIAILPMGFCYPGRGKSGDLPPRPECAEQWREKVIARMKRIKLVLVIGMYAQAWHLRDTGKKSVTEVVKSWRKYQPGIFPLPHPSPRNINWLKKNPWFEAEVLPALRQRVKITLQ